MLIPKYLKDFAGIRSEVMIIGVSNRIEVWDVKKWDEFYNSEKGSFEKISENLLSE